MGFPHPSHPRETPLLTRHFGEEEARTLAGWKKRGGYQALEKALGFEVPVSVRTLEELRKLAAHRPFPEKDIAACPTYVMPNSREWLSLY